MEGERPEPPEDFDPSQLQRPEGMEEPPEKPEGEEGGFGREQLGGELTTEFAISAGTNMFSSVQKA